MIAHLHRAHWINLHPRHMKSGINCVIPGWMSQIADNDAQGVQLNRGRAASASSLLDGTRSLFISLMRHFGERMKQPLGIGIGHRTRYPAMTCQLTTSFWWFIFQRGTWSRNWQSDTIVSVQYHVWQDRTPGEAPLATDPAERMLTRAVISSSALSPEDHHALHAVLLVCFLACLNSQKGATPTFPPSLQSQRTLWVCVCVPLLFPAFLPVGPFYPPSERLIVKRGGFKV